MVLCVFPWAGDLVVVVDIIRRSNRIRDLLVPLQPLSDWGVLRGPWELLLIFLAPALSHAVLGTLPQTLLLRVVLPWAWGISGGPGELPGLRSHPWG